MEIQSIEGAAPELAVARDSVRLVADNSELYLAYGSRGDKLRLGADPRGLIERIDLKRYTGATSTVETIDLAGLRVEYIGGDDSEILLAADGFANVITGGGGRDILIGAGLADELVGGARQRRDEREATAATATRSASAAASMSSTTTARRGSTRWRSA